MHRAFLATAALIVATAAHAHHIWIIPDNPNGTKATVVFGDYLRPEGPAFLDNIGHAKLFMRDAAGKESPITWKKADDVYHLDVPGDGERTVAGKCIYGVVNYDHRKRSTVDPYLLIYYPKTILGLARESKAWEKQPIEIVPTVYGDEVQLQVLFHGKPAANAEMRFHSPDGGRQELKTDAKGQIMLPFKTAGSYGFQTRQIVGQGGEHEGKRYVEVRHYASLVLVRE